MDNKDKKTAYAVIYIMILLAASLPLACAYIMEGGENLVWIDRIEEAAEGIRRGRWMFFPSPGAPGAEGHALNSNLWLFVPALVRVWSGDIVTAYRISMMLVNCVTLYSLSMMFGRIFSDKTTVLYGVLFSMTCPYRIWLCYDRGDMGKAAAWMLIPLFMWGMAGLYTSRIRWKEIAACSLAFAGIGYADGIMLAVTAGCAVLGVLWYKKPQGLLPVAIGGVLYLPGAAYLAEYLFRGGMDAWNLPLGSIMADGYVFGQFFTAYAYQAGRPGLGLGLFGALAVLMWLCFVDNGQDVMKKYGFYVALSGLLLWMSMSCFPWDLVQRAGGVFLRLVSLMETPGIFFGFASVFLCVPAAYGVECLRRREGRFVRIGIPLILLAASVGGAVYLCNDLTFTRYPLIWQAAYGGE